MNLLIALFSPATGTWGGLTRVITVAEAARQAGHQIAFCASGYLSTSLKERGFTVYPVPQATMLGLPAQLSRIIERRRNRRYYQSNQAVISGISGLSYSFPGRLVLLI